jgi:hypothetical protein
MRRKKPPLSAPKDLIETDALVEEAATEGSAPELDATTVL